MFGVSYATDLSRAEAVLVGLVAAEVRIDKAPELMIKVSVLNQSSVDFTLPLWCSASDYLALKFDMTRAVKEAFDAAEIDIPFPTTTIVQAGKQK